MTMPRLLDIPFGDVLVRNARLNKQVYGSTPTSTQCTHNQRLWLTTTDFSFSSLEILLHGGNQQSLVGIRLHTSKTRRLAGG